MNNNKTDSQDAKFNFKCALLGASGSGKTSIITRYIFDRFDLYSAPTIGAAYNSRKIQTQHGLVRIDIWDTAGQERFESLIPLYYKNADVVVIVYDVTSRDSYKKAQGWIERIKRELVHQPVFILIGNKVDLDGRQIEISEAQAYADYEHVIFIECSAKMGINVSNIFEQSCISAIERILTQPRDDVRIDMNGQVIDLDQTQRSWFLPSCFGTAVNNYNPITYFRSPSSTASLN